MEASHLSTFKSLPYLNLETFRKTGAGVPTPVWFVEDQGVLYVRTRAETGKVKRVRNNSRVRVAPCDSRGNLHGEWLEGKAVLVDEATSKRVNRLLLRKYGLMKIFFEVLAWFAQAKSATIAIELH